MAKKRFVASSIAILVSLTSLSLAGAGMAQASSPAKNAVSSQTPTDNTQTQDGRICQAKGRELCDPDSTTVVVNKTRQLDPVTYRPLLVTTNMPLSPYTTPGSEETQVRPEVSTMLDLMYFQAKVEGINLTFRSGFRSMETQAQVYADFLAEGGQEYADKYVARPGYSEHQTGLAADINIDIPDGSPDTDQLATAGYQWIADNAYKFGFVVRYQEGNKPVTGFNPEPWHLRFVGQDLSPLVANIPLETYFGLPPAPDYPPATAS